jgi:hypothetical protein
MGFTTLVDYSRQLTQVPNTSAEFSGDTTILGSLTLGSLKDSWPAMTTYYSYLFMTGGTLTNAHTRYNPKTYTWEVNMPDPTDATLTEYAVNRLKINLSDAGQNGQFGSFAQQSVFRYTSFGFDTIENSGHHNPATVMIMGSGTTSASTAFTVSNYNTTNGIGMTGFTIDDGMNVRIGDRRPYANVDSNTCQVFLGPGGILNNVELFDTLKIGSEGLVGTTASLRHLKTNIDYEYDSSWIYKLKPAQFEFKKFPGNVQYGLIAEDVNDINPDFAKFNSDGSLRGVKDELLSSVILKELIELRKKVDPSFNKDYEKDKVKVISTDHEIIYDGTIIARGGGDIKLTISDSLSGIVRIKSLANVTVSSNRLIDEKWSEMVLENGSSISLLCHNKFIYILSSDGDKTK